MNIFTIHLNGKVVGFEKSSSWAPAAKAGAAKYNRTHQTTVPWEKFIANWLNPKQYEHFGITVNKEDGSVILPQAA